MGDSLSVDRSISNFNNTYMFGMKVQLGYVFSFYECHANSVAYIFRSERNLFELSCKLSHIDVNNKNYSYRWSRLQDTNTPCAHDISLHADTQNKHFSQTFSSLTCCRMVIRLLRTLWETKTIDS